MSDQTPERNGAIRINEAPCATCPFVDASKRAFDFVSPEDAAALKSDCQKSSRFEPNVCHASVYGMHGIKGGASVCAGFIAANPTHPFVLHNRFAYPKPVSISVTVPKKAKP